MAGVPLKVPPGSQNGGEHIVFVPVPGQLVFCVCLLLIAMCVIWLLMLLSKGVKFDKES